MRRELKPGRLYLLEMIILGLFGIAAVAYSLRELLPTIPEWVPPVAMLGALGFVLWGASKLRE